MHKYIQMLSHIEGLLSDTDCTQHRGVILNILHEISLTFQLHKVYSCTTNGSVSKKSPTGPTERTPKPEYLMTLPTYLGVRW